jgi:putative inorganic carbon (hco3(-)) transporter
MKKYISPTFWFGVLFFITPIIISSSTSEMFEIPKMFLVYIIATVIVAVSIIHLLLFGDRDITIKRIHLLYGFFIITQIVSLLFSIDRNVSWYGYYGRFNGGMLSVIVFGILFFVGSIWLNSVDIKKIVIFSITASLVVMLLGLPGRFIGVDTMCILFRSDFSNDCWTDEFRPAERMFSTLGQPNWLGAYFAIHTCLGLYLLFQSKGSLSHLLMQNKRAGETVKKRQYPTILLTLYILLMSSGVVMTGSRSAMLAVLIIPALETVRLFLRLYGRFMTIIVAGIVVIVMSTLLIAYLKNITTNTSKITHSGRIRLIVWEGGLRTWLKNPFVGTGPETFAYSYFQNRPLAHNDTTEKDFIYNKAHNEFLNYLANTGLLGLIGYFGVLIYAVICVIMRHDFVSRVWAHLIIVTSATNFFGFSTSTIQLLLVLGLTASVMNDKVIFNISKFIRNVHGISKLKYPMLILTLITCIFVLTIFARHFQADLIFAKAQRDFEASDFVSSMQNCLKSYQLKSDHAFADKCATLSANIAIALSNSDEVSEDIQKLVAYLVELSDFFANIALSSSPHNPIYLKNRIRILDAFINSAVLANSNLKNYESEFVINMIKFKKIAPTDFSLSSLR